MGYKIVPILMIIITWSLLNIPFAFPGGDYELDHICDLPGSSGREFNGNFSTSRWFTASYLSINTASKGGYANTSYNFDNEMCYGLASCRGDISDDECTNCLNNATNTLINTTDHCPYARSAMIWYEYCFFKYSDTDFLGKVDTGNNTRRLTSDGSLKLTSSRDVVKKLLSTLTQTAIQDPTKFYAKGSDMLPLLNGKQYDPNKVYGMVQCTRDLTPDDCKTCLDVTLTMVLAINCGEHVVTGSCNIRYETFDFSKN